jgi:AcrR family transcriptional regulator
VAEAARLVDELGPEALTLKAVADRFAVALPSLYKHLGGLADLHARLATLATHELGAALLRATSGRSRTDALVAVAEAYRGYAARHPGRYGYLLRPRPGDDAHALAAGEVLAVLYDVLAGYGIDDEDSRVDATRFLRSTLHGFVSLEIAGGFALARPVDRTFERVVLGVDAALRAWPQGSEPHHAPARMGP